VRFEGRHDFVGGREATGSLLGEEEGLAILIGVDLERPCRRRLVLLRGHVNLFARELRTKILGELLDLTVVASARTVNDVHFNNHF